MLNLDTGTSLCVETPTCSSECGATLLLTVCLSPLPSSCPRRLGPAWSAPSLTRHGFPAAQTLPHPGMSKTLRWCLGQLCLPRRGYLVSLHSSHSHFATISPFPTLSSSPWPTIVPSMLSYWKRHCRPSELSKTELPSYLPGPAG